MRRLSFVVIASSGVSLLLVLWLNGNSIIAAGAPLMLLLGGLLLHAVWLIPYFAAALSCGARYRSASVPRRWGVFALGSFVLLFLGSGWSFLLFAGTAVLQSWAGLRQYASMEMFCRIVSRLEYPYPYSSLCAAAGLLAAMFWPRSWLLANSDRGASCASA